MEDDFSQIVGVSLEMWATLVVFVLISGPLGWVALPFVVLSALVLVAVNVKIIWVIRWVLQLSSQPASLAWLGLHCCPSFTSWGCLAASVASQPDLQRVA